MAGPLAAKQAAIMELILFSHPAQISVGGLVTQTTETRQTAEGGGRGGRRRPLPYCSRESPCVPLLVDAL